MTVTTLRRFAPWICGLFATLLALLLAHGRSSPYNNYVAFADALLHGRLWVDGARGAIDAVTWNGHQYIVNDPVPALFLVPFVAVIGIAANQTTLACLLAGVAAGAAWALCRRLGVDELNTAWLTLFYLAGTDLLWCSMLGDVWFIAQTSAVAFTTLMLLELAGPRRAWLVALWFGLAAGSRFTVIMAGPIVAYWLAYGFQRPAERPDVRRVGQALLAFAPFVLLWVAYNEARWQVPWDSGHTIFYHQDRQVGSLAGSPFSLANVPMQAYSFFIQLPEFYAAYPFVVPPYVGTALTWTSPALGLAFFARRPRRLVLSCWAAVALVAAPSFLYYVNGFIQFGMRHALDFEPFLLVLMALVAVEGLHAVVYVLIGWSVAVGLWGCWFWNVFYRPHY